MFQFITELPLEPEAASLPYQAGLSTVKPTMEEPPPYKTTRKNVFIDVRREKELEEPVCMCAANARKIEKAAALANAAAGGPGSSDFGGSASRPNDSPAAVFAGADGRGGGTVVAEQDQAAAAAGGGGMCQGDACMNALLMVECTDKSGCDPEKCLNR